MENSITDSPTLEGPSRSRRRSLLCTVYLLFSAIIIAGVLNEYSSSHERKPDTSFTNPSFSLLQATCNTTFYPSLCFSTLSKLPASKKATGRKEIIEISIHRTAESVESSLLKISRLLDRKDLNRRQKGALSDCVEMLEQTLYELRNAVQDLRKYPINGSFNQECENLKTLLSAAMTNQNSCLEGLATEGQNHLKKYVRNRLLLITRLASNSLAMVRDMQAAVASPRGLPKIQRSEITEMPRYGSPAWLPAGCERIIRGAEIVPDVVVASDGSGDYQTIGEAVAAAPMFRKEKFVIRIKGGLYEEYLEIPKEKTNIMLVGDGRDATIIYGHRNVHDGSSASTTYNSATLGVSGDGFIGRDLTIANTAGPHKGQAVALRVNANLAAFYRCNITGYQDTLYAHSLRQFYRDCTISGTVDFIFGNAAAVFQNCNILVRKPIPGQKNMITAHARDDLNQNTGISIINSTIAAAPDLHLAGVGTFKTYLGRPWRNFSRTVVMKSYLGDLIDPAGWHVWNPYTDVETVEYVEFMNWGPGSSLMNRVWWGGYKRNFTKVEAMQFTVGEFIQGWDWLGESGFPIAYGL